MPPLTPPVAPRSLPDEPGCIRGTRTASPALSSKRTAFPAQGVFPRQVLPGGRFRGHSDLREPATDLAVLPPTIRLPTLFHPPERSRVGRLDPSSVPADSSSTGARGRASLVDFCNRCDPRAQPRTAELRRTSPAVARWRSHFHDLDLSVAILNCGWRRLSRGAASRDFTGQGPRPRQLPRRLGTSHRDRSRRELRPNPIDSDTSCRCSLLAQAGDACAACDPVGTPITS